MWIITFFNIITFRYYITILASFSQQSLRVFHDSFSWWTFTGVWEAESLLRWSSEFFQADLKNAIVKMVSIRLPIFNSSPLSKHLVFQALQLQSVLPPSSDSTTFLVPWQGPSTCHSFLSFLFLVFIVSTWDKGSGSYYSQFICPHISRITRSENQHWVVVLIIVFVSEIRTTNKRRNIRRSWYSDQQSGSHVDLDLDLDMSFFMGNIMWLY